MHGGVMAIGSILGSLGAMVGAQNSGLANNAANGLTGGAVGVGTSVQNIAQTMQGIPWPTYDPITNQWILSNGFVVSTAVAPTEEDAIKYYIQYTSSNVGAYTQPVPPPPTYIHTSRPNRLKLDMAFKRLAEGLPFRVASTLEAKFGPEGSTTPAFEIHYSSGQITRFENIDTFPTEADIARICLEAP